MIQGVPLFSRRTGLSSIATGTTDTEDNKEEIIKTCVHQVLQILKDKADR